MIHSPKKPHYAAAIFVNADARTDPVPVPIDDAKSDVLAIEFGEQRADRWLADNTMDRAIIQILKDGKTLRSIQRPIPMALRSRGPQKKQSTLGG